MESGTPWLVSIRVRAESLDFQTGTVCGVSLLRKPNGVSTGSSKMKDSILNGTATAHQWSPDSPREVCLGLRSTMCKVFWLSDHSTGRTFPSQQGVTVVFRGFRPRLQRRARPGFSPCSLGQPWVMSFFRHPGRSGIRMSVSALTSSRSAFPHPRESGGRLSASR